MNFTPPPSAPPTPPTPPARSQGTQAFNLNAQAFAAWLVSLGTWLGTFVSYLVTFIGELGVFKAAINSAVSGGAFAIDYAFSSATTAADPGAGTLRLNAAQQNTATAIYLDVLSADGANWQAALDLMDDSDSTVKGFITLRAQGDGTKFLVFTLASMAQPSGYRTAVVTCVASSSANPFASGDLITLSFDRTGDRGLQGIPGPQGDVSLTGVQTLTNKTLSAPTINGGAASGLTLNDGYTEEVYAITDGGSVNLNPANGSIQTWTLGASRTPTATFSSGQSLTLLVNDGTAYSITWTTAGVVWVGGSAPSLATSGYTVLNFWKVGSVLYGMKVGEVA